MARDEILASWISFTSAFFFLIIFINIMEFQKKQPLSKASESKSSTIFLYPGYITKTNGKILWHSQKPVFDEENEQWINLKAVDVTNCIHDPWPAETGGEKLILEVKDYDSQK